MTRRSLAVTAGGNRKTGGLACLGLLVSCCSSERTEPPRPVDSTPAPAAPGEVRGAAGDADIRVMMAEVAAGQACDLIRGYFQPLPAVDRPNVVTGTLWIRECRITRAGTKVTFRLAGNGWQWVDQVKNKAGGTFSVRQYVRFGLTARFSGTLDVAYDPSSHVATVWFSPEGEPAVQFAPIGRMNVDAEGAWSSVLSALGSMFASSPEDAAKKEAKALGAVEFKKQFADGLSVTVDLCTGLARVGLGRTDKGKMNAPGVGETSHVSVELQPGGLMLSGPRLAGGGMTLNAHVPSGTAAMSLVCNDQAEVLARAFVEGRPLPGVHLLASRTIRGKATLRARPARCPVTTVARSLHVSGTARPVMLDWQRPRAEAGSSTGGRLVDCPERAPAGKPAP